jgi:hypothetical protein
MKSTEEEGTEDKTLPRLMGKVRSSNQHAAPKDLFLHKNNFLKILEEINC